MLENLARKKSLTPAPTPRCRSCAAFGRATHRRALEFSRRPARAFFSTEKRVAEHSGDGIFTAQKMHLKAVRLFFRARPGIEAADIRFRIGIGSSSHERLPNNYVKQRGNQRVAVVLSLGSGFFRRGQLPCPPFFFIFIGGQEGIARVS